MNSELKKKAHLMWVDDEIDLLKPHIIYLEKRGYSIDPVNSGEDAIHMITEKDYDLVLLDEMMDGLDGLTTLKILKERRPHVPVVMVTKNEEEWLMEEAIGEQIAYYLTKPVNPSQILLACKNILETPQIHSDKTTREYLQEFQEISASLDSLNSIEAWYKVFNDLTKWSIKFDIHGDETLRNILVDQYEDADQKFTQFIVNNYVNWLESEEHPLFSTDIIRQSVLPALKADEKVVVIVVDCLRHDHWLAISELLHPYFGIQNEYSLSILPTATPYSRNAIFSGLFPSEIQSRYSKIWREMSADETSMNRYEDTFLRDQLDRLGFQNKSMKYQKILTYEDGHKLGTRINEYRNVDVLSIVVNFVDMLGHTRSESDVLKELVPDESAYRNAVCSWFENAWLLNVLKQIGSWGRKVIITSDHGTVRVNKPIRVKADKSASTGVRYKFGRNLVTDKRAALFIENPPDYKLPKDELTTNFILAKGHNYFVYPNEYRHFVNKFENSFQHGGISMAEMIVPLATLSGKKL